MLPRIIHGCVAGFLCTILLEETVQVVQTEPQRVSRVTSYEWCVQDKTLILVKRDYWVIDKQTTRQEQHDSPSSQSTTLWSSLGD